MQRPNHQIEVARKPIHPPEYHLEGVIFRGYFLDEVFADYW
jgi:hypothetical protein